ncbi:AAA family ATPase [Shimia thalassica]|uniref:AAA family ATPase n=1 Tax=Shimia thalassica TaxID=1715693 RepID=UPI002736AD84|nr:AAA family ATPase [Shimia thalassica]MDP2582090.1 AAA family ATPase [Shimia thalassica]
MGPHFANWSTGTHSIDLPEISVLYRLCMSLPSDPEDLARIVFKPAALTIIEVSNAELFDYCANALERGVLAVVRSRYDYLPEVRVSTDGHSFANSLSSRFKKSKSEDLPASLVSQTPTVILVPDQQDLPDAVARPASATFTLPPLSRDEIDVLYRVVHGISLQAVLPDLLADLPHNDSLQQLPLEGVYGAIRRPTASDVSEALRAAVHSKQVKEVQGALDQVIGLGPARQQLEQIAEDLVSWKSGNLAWEDMTRGVLFYGQPGTGKTFCAQKLSEQCGAHFVSASYAEWQRHGHLGDLLAAMTKSFKEARDRAPSVLFLDEIDAFGDRKTAAGDNAGYTRSVINALLEQLDGVGKHEGVLVVGACNFPELLDDALVRAGRFDLKINLPMPGKNALVELLKLHLDANADEGPLPSLAQRLIGSSGADVAALVRQARSLARQKKRAFSIGDLQNVVAASVTTMSDADLWRGAVHEAGHAVVGNTLGKGLPLSARISAYGGEVIFKNSSPLPGLDELVNELSTLLAGRASEEVLLGTACSGSGGTEESDLAKATKMALYIETAFGLGSSGLTWRPVSGESVTSLLGNKEMSQRVEARLQEALGSAKAIIAEQQTLVETMASQLVLQRELSSGEISEVLNAGKHDPAAINDAEAMLKQDAPTQGSKALV